MTDWSRARALFPAVTRQVYLNTAGGAPVPVPVAEAGAGYYRQSLEDGDVHWDAWIERVEEVRGRTAALLAADAEEIAFTGNASAGLALAAHMLAGRGGVLTVRDEFPSVSLPWLQLGHDVHFVATGVDGEVTLPDLDEAWQAAAASDEVPPGVLAVSSVQFKSGYRFDLGELGAFCREREMELVVDATQELGAFPVDVGTAGAGVLVSSGYKWLTSGYGVGILRVGSELLDRLDLPVAGWRSAREPYRLKYDELDLSHGAAALEQGHPPFPGVFALGAALELIDEIGIEAIAGRIRELVDRLRKKLGAAGFRVRSTPDPAHMSGICVVDVEDGPRRVAALAHRDIVVSSRGRGVRVSVHYYNDEGDVDRLVDALVELR